jgi:hypothetical protein
VLTLMTPYIGVGLCGCLAVGIFGVIRDDAALGSLAVSLGILLLAAMAIMGAAPGHPL